MCMRIQSKASIRTVCVCGCLRLFVQKAGDENRFLVFFFSRRYYRKGRTDRIKRSKNRWPQVCILHTNNAAENPNPNENVPLSIPFGVTGSCACVYALYVQTMSCTMHTTGIRRTISAVGIRSISFYRASSFFIVVENERQTVTRH